MTKQKLRVFWIPQIPMKPFLIAVDSTKEAKKIMDVLAKYDTFQYENNIKPDYSNTGGLETLNEEETHWIDWNCTNCDKDIDNCECDTP
jgi:hypothetical protein